MGEQNNRFLDALIPAEMALRAEETGVKKATLNFWSLLALSILAGAFIAFGAVLSTVAVTGADTVLPFGLTRLIGGFVFSLGLILVVVGGAELFTGNNLIVMAWASGKISTIQVVRNWTVVFFGNFVGAIGVVVAVFLSGHQTFAAGGVAKTALSIASAKTELGFREAVFLGILCNILVCLAIWLSYSARTTTDKILAVVPPISAFVASGFEHSVANMYFVPIALLIKFASPESFWVLIGRTAADYPTLTVGDFLLNNLIPVTIGNLIGGAFLVGIVYWFVYLRKRNGPDREDGRPS